MLGRLLYLHCYFRKFYELEGFTCELCWKIILHGMSYCGKDVKICTHCSNNYDYAELEVHVNTVTDCDVLLLDHNKKRLFRNSTKVWYCMEQYVLHETT